MYLFLRFSIMASSLTFGSRTMSSTPEILTFWLCQWYTCGWRNKLISISENAFDFVLSWNYWNYKRSDTREISRRRALRIQLQFLCRGYHKCLFAPTFHGSPIHRSLSLLFQRGFRPALLLCPFNATAYNRCYTWTLRYYLYIAFFKQTWLIKVRLGLHRKRRVLTFYPVGNTRSNVIHLFILL